MTPEHKVGLFAADYCQRETDSPVDNLLILCYALGLKDDPEAKESDNLSRHVRYNSRKKRKQNRGSDPTHHTNLRPKEDSPRYKRFKD